MDTQHEIKELIMRGLESRSAEELDRISILCKNNCQAVGGQWCEDIRDVTNERDLVSILIDPLDLMLFFDTREQYEKYMVLEKVMPYDRQKLLVPLSYIIYYKDTRECLYLSEYEPREVIDFLAKNTGNRGIITQYDSKRHVIKLEKHFENFMRFIWTMDPLARGPKRMATYWYSQNRNLEDDLSAHYGTKVTIVYGE